MIVIWSVNECEGLKQKKSCNVFIYNPVYKFAVRLVRMSNEAENDDSFC